VKLLQIPRPYLYAGILTFAAFGAYAVNFSIVDVLILVVIGLLGFFMRRFGYPIAPLVVGMILGPMAEAQLRRALQLSQGDLTTLVAQPFAATAYVLMAVLVIVGLWLRRRQRRFEEAMTEELSVVQPK
jgi:putative tricarboxylic transport membrane protein